MILKQISLSEIRTYKNSSIKFDLGTNLLHGANGSGKSTVLKMIGYALFNTKIKKEDFIRNYSDNSKKSGKVSVIIEHNDGREYLIERDVAKGSTNPKVYTRKDPGDEWHQLDYIRKVQDFVQWMHEKIGLDKEIPLDKFFDNAIGVSQGDFVAPFLLPQKRRKEHFEPIFNLDIYTKIADKMVFVINKINSELNELNDNIKILEGKLKNKENTVQNINSNKERLKAINQKLEVDKKEYERINKRYNEMKKLEEEINRLDKRHAQLKEKLESFNKSLKDLEERIGKSKKAAEICARTEHSYHRYNELKEKIAQLQKKYDELKNLEKLSIKINTKIHEKEQNINSLNEQKREIEELRESFNSLKKSEEEYIANKNELDKLSEEITLLKQKREQLTEKQMEYQNLSENVKNLNQSLADMERFKNRLEDLEKKQEKLNRLKEELAEKTSTLKQYEKNKRESEGGNCPILKERCQNIGGGSLEEYFQQKIDELRPKIELLNKTINELNKELKELPEIRNKLIQLQRIEGQRSELKKRMKELKAEISNLNAAVGKIEQIEMQYAEKKKRYSDLEKLHDKYIRLKQRFEEDLPKIEKRIEQSERGLNELHRRLKEVNEKLSPLKQISEDLEKFRAELTKIEEKYKLYLANKEWANQLEGLTQKLNKQIEEIKQLENKLRQLNENIKEKEKHFNKEHFEELGRKKENLNGEIGKLEGEKRSIEANLKQSLELLKQYEEDEKRKERLEMESFSKNELKMLIEFIREIYKNAPENIIKIAIRKVSEKANMFFQEILANPLMNLEWDETFNITIHLRDGSKRSLSQLSGGEQMAAALAARLAILKFLSNIDFVLLDEPTPHLDAEKRENLAETIARIEGFRQIFVISHDETFENKVDHVIRLRKNDLEITEVDYGPR